MSWLFGSSKPKPKLSADGTPEAPSRNDRQQCWDARDGFFECLTRHNIIDSIKEDAEARKNCAEELRGFEQNCATTWVSLDSGGFFLLAWGHGWVVGM